MIAASKSAVAAVDAFPRFALLDGQDVQLLTPHCVAPPGANKGSALSRAAAYATQSPQLSAAEWRPLAKLAVGVSRDRTISRYDRRCRHGNQRHSDPTAESHSARRHSERTLHQALASRRRARLRNRGAEAAREGRDLRV